MEKMRLNVSQEQIALSETVEGASINTISLKLFFSDINASDVKKAAEAVMLSADIFSVELCRDEDGLFFKKSSKNNIDVQIKDAMSAEDLRSYISECDCMPLNYPEELYRAEVIPVAEGGVQLYVRFHHIITDGFGMNLFAQSVLDVLGGKAPLKSAFFAKEAQKPCDLRSFWSNYLGDAEFESAIYGEQSSSSSQGISKYTVPCDKSGIEKFAVEQGVTPPYVLAAAMAVYLACASCKKDAVFLMPRLNRRQEELNVIGCCTLLVPVRVTIDGEDSFADVCKKVQQSARLASENKGCGYSEILRYFRDGGGMGVVSQYVFNFYNFSVRSDLDYSLDFSVAGGMRNHITFNIFQKESGYNFTIDANKSLPQAKAAQYFCDSIQEILKGGLNNLQIKDIEITGEDERASLSSISDGISYPVGSDTIPSLFKRVAKTYPDRIALYAGEKSFTFKQLDLLTDGIAGTLINKGVKSGDIVAFLLKRDYRLIPVMLGISKAGAAFVPIDAEYPSDRVGYIISDSRAKMLISSPDVPNAEGLGYVDVDSLFGENQAVELPCTEQSSLAYIIYTSGTTGKPKGVMLSHKGIANIVSPENNPFNRDAVKNCKGIVAVGSVSFDISLFEIFVPMFNGLFVEFGNEAAMKDAATLAAAIKRHGADILHCTPSRIAAYLKNKDFVSALKGIKVILSAGETLSSELATSLKQAGIRIYNGYGPTETTIGATITESCDVHTIGKPIGNAGIVILNDYNKCVPFGANGEICIYGAGVGIGYKNLDAETAKRFVPWNGKTIYKSGDLGRFSTDGRILYLGRRDRQIKLRGLRIELSEIEKAACSYTGITNFCACVRKEGNAEFLTGFYSVNNGNSVNAEDLKAYLRTCLAPYMVPEVLHELAEIPMTQSGKADVKALNKIPLVYNRSYRAPVTRAERIICDVFAEILGRDKVGLDDNYFELGGDSLGAVELLMQLEQRLGTGTTIDYGDLYKHPTPAMLSSNLLNSAKAEEGYDLTDLDYSGIDGLLAAKNDDAEYPLGNVLLTGATGYLGIHMLIELLKNPSPCKKVVCLVRNKGKMTAERRIKANLFYFDSNDYSEGYGSKWYAVSGDITTQGLTADEWPCKIDTIINCAADVSHFDYGGQLNTTNVEGVENLIQFALGQNARLCQVSTISVGGMDCLSIKKDIFTEEDFYVGQQIFNQYIYTKYMAEYKILRAAADKNLKFKLFRVGNLQGRISDGEFQMNKKYNAFTRSLISYVKIGAVPSSVYNSMVNFAPVDDTAKNIIALAGQGTLAALHVCPTHEMEFSRLFERIHTLGYDVKVLSDKEFANTVEDLKQTSEGRGKISGLMTERTDGSKRYIDVSCTSTNHLLENLGKGWSEITDSYIDNYLTALTEADLFLSEN